MNRVLPQDLALRDIHLPPAPSWWPPAPGWWLLFGGICLASFAAYLIYRRMRRIRIWQARILAEIPALAARHPDDDVAYASALHQLLRRVARRYAIDAHQLQGERWRKVLAQVPIDTATLDTLMKLEARMYQQHAEFDRAAMQAAALRWLQSALRNTKEMVKEPRHA
jgi:Domain of unknown function (DUF4381)